MKKNSDGKDLLDVPDERVLAEKKRLLKKLEKKISAERQDAKRKEEELKRFIAEEEAEIQRMKEELASFLSSEESKLKTREEKFLETREEVIGKKSEFIQK